MKDYTTLASKLRSKAGEIFRDTTANEVTKLTKPSSVSSVSSPEVISGKNKADAGRGSVSFVSSQRVGTPKNSGPVGGILEALKTRNTSPGTLTKPTKLSRSKTWRPLPDWLTCLAATGDPTSAQQFFTALCVEYGHPADAIAERLRLVVPHHLRQPVKPLIRPEWAAKYMEAHPFRWELEMNTTAFNCLKAQIAA